MSVCCLLHRVPCSCLKDQQNSNTHMVCISTHAGALLIRVVGFALAMGNLNPQGAACFGSSFRPCSRFWVSPPPFRRGRISGGPVTASVCGARSNNACLNMTRVWMIIVSRGLLYSPAKAGPWISFTRGACGLPSAARGFSPLAGRSSVYWLWCFPSRNRRLPNPAVRLPRRCGPGS
jgi:hypothetical protein